jgi:hypothetical protein
MIKYVSKFALDILPSVAATIIGAYIVNHYITAKPAADAPVAAALSSAKGGIKIAPAPTAARAVETSTDAANIPGAGVKAKGISEKAILDRSVAEQPQDKAGAKPVDKPAETASIPAEPRRHLPLWREKSVAKAVAAAPPSPSAPAVEAAVAPEDHRDANELARAAIERLRGSNEISPRAPQEAARIPDAVRNPDTTRTADAPYIGPAPAVRPLPPPIMVSTPSTETLDPAAGSPQIKQIYASTARTEDPLRPTPPADIPSSRPLDLRADAAEPVAHQRTTVAEDVLSAAKSVFHAVLPR